VGVNVKLDVARLKKGLMLQQSQVRFATAVALTRTAKVAEQEIKRKIDEVFDNPTPFTRNSTYVTPATKDRLWSEVKIKDEAMKAIAPIKWLAPQRSEDLLRKAGILAPGMFMVPAAGVKLDRYGNMSRGQLQQVLSQVQAQRDTLANQTARSKRRNKGRSQYFALRVQRGKLRPGIYQRFSFAHGSAVRPVFIFVKQPKYMVRLPFHAIAQKVVDAQFSYQFRKAMLMAVRTAR
jgi:folate-binding Fe-S cluster repair protein YgfZ